MRNVFRTSLLKNISSQYYDFILLRGSSAMNYKSIVFYGGEGRSSAYLMVAVSTGEVLISPKFTSTDSPYKHNNNFGLKLHLIKLIRKVL